MSYIDGFVIAVPRENREKFVHHAGVADPVFIEWGATRVLECWDREQRRYCAVKVIRNVKKYRDASMMEIDVLHKIAKVRARRRTSERARK